MATLEVDDLVADAETHAEFAKDRGALFTGLDEPVKDSCDVLGLQPGLLQAVSNDLADDLWDGESLGHVVDEAAALRSRSNRPIWRAERLRQIGCQPDAAKWSVAVSGASAFRDADAGD